jgi:hypothetical protein
MELWKMTEVPNETEVSNLNKPADLRPGFKPLSPYWEYVWPMKFKRKAKQQQRQLFKLGWAELTKDKFMTPRRAILFRGAVLGFERMAYLAGCPEQVPPFAWMVGEGLVTPRPGRFYELTKMGHLFLSQQWEFGQVEGYWEAKPKRKNVGKQERHCDRDQRTRPPMWWLPLDTCRRSHQPRDK